MARDFLSISTILVVMLIYPMVSQCKELRRQGLLETRPPIGAEQGQRFCIHYFPSIHNLTDERNQAVSHRVANLTGWDGCGKPGPSPLPETAQRWVLLNQSRELNCSIDERVATLRKLNAAGIVIQVNESFSAMATNQSESPIPVTFILWTHVADILSTSPTVEAIQYGIPSEQPFNYSLVVIGIVANLTIVLGALWSATVKYELYMLEEAAQRARRAGGTDASSASATTQLEPSSMNVSVIAVMVSIVLIITLLLLSYFFPGTMFYVVLVLFFMGSVSGLYTCLNPIAVRAPWGCDLGMVPAVPRCPSCRMRVSSLLLCVVSLAVGVVWLVLRDDHTWGWPLQDLLGVAFSLSIIRSLRLPSLRIGTLMAVGLFIYDIFFVFITPLFTPDGKSIMEEVATGGGENIMPLVLKVPSLIRTPYPECFPSDTYSLLGYGDIILPGLIVAYCAAVDKIFTGRHIYLITSATGYAVGLIITFVAVQAMDRAQPALLYLVPLVLLPVMLVALIRRQFLVLWTGGRQATGAQLIQESHAGYDAVDGRDQE